MALKSCVAIVGASDKPHRYSYQALKLLQEHGYSVYPLHVRILQIDGTPVYQRLQDIPVGLDTITLYVNEAVSAGMTDVILQVKPRRIIFNPGAENDKLELRCREVGIQTLRACTLVLLKTGKF